MTLSPETYLTHLQAESARFRAVLTGCDPAARVPACPDWTAADLLHHLTEVQTFWAVDVEQRPAQAVDGEGLPRAASYEEMLTAFDAASERLATALASAPPTDEAWTWSTDHTVGFVLRRQAHEALIHRLDAEQTAGDVTALDAVLATDGVLETLAVMFGGAPEWGTFVALDHLVRVDTTDTDSSVWVRLGQFTGTDPKDGVSYDEPDIRVVPVESLDADVEPDAVVDGEAGVLDAWLWRRGDDTGVHVTGDRGIYDRFRIAVDHPIN